MAMLVDNQKMTDAHTNINQAAEDFAKAGTELIGQLKSVLSTFEGDTKDALWEAKIGESGSEAQGTLACFVEKQIPDLVKGLAKLLEGNRSTIDDSDKKLAEAIRSGGKG